MIFNKPIYVNPKLKKNTKVKILFFEVQIKFFKIFFYSKELIFNSINELAIIRLKLITL